MQTHYKHNKAPLCSLDEGALQGLRHRTVIDYRTGAKSLAIWQEEHLGGFHVPLHLHDCEEIISVLSGTIRAQINDESFIIASGESILIPEMQPHGFSVVSEEPVKLLAIFSKADPRILKVDGEESTPPWEGGHTDHLQQNFS